MELTGKRGLRIAFTAALLGHAIWGFSFLFTRIGLRIIPIPAVLLSMRFTAAFIIMSILLLAGKAEFHIRGKHLRPLVLLSIMEPLSFFFESYGILYTSATCAGMVMAMSPVVSILLAAVFLKEIPTRIQLLFCGLPVVGVILITLAGSELGVITPFGLFLLLCNCVTAGAYRIMNRKSSEEFTSFERTYIVLAVSAVVFTVMALVQLKGDLQAYAAPLQNPAYIFAVAMLSVFCSVAAYMLVNYGAARMTVAKLAVFGAVSTICSTFAGVVLLKEPVSWMVLLGAALIVIGVWQVMRRGG